MALRGTGSLQELLGRNVVAKKRNNNSNKRAREDTDNQIAEQLPVANETSNPLAAPKTSSPLKPGCGYCPVCDKQIPISDLAALNAHIDKCLLKSKPKRPAHQSTLLHFRTPAAAAAASVGGGTSPAPVAPAAAAAGKESSYSARQQSSHQNHHHQHDNCIQPSTSAVQKPQFQHFIAPAAQVQVPSSPLSWTTHTTTNSEAPAQSPLKAETKTVTKQKPSLAGLSGGFSSPIKVHNNIVHSKVGLRSPLTSPLKSGGGRLPSTPLSVPPPTCFTCSVVGRRFQSSSDLHLGQRILIQLELNNPRDGNALLVVDADSKTAVGHLPRIVAQHLGPLLRKGAASAEGIVIDVPDSGRAPASIDLQVTLLVEPTMSAASPERSGAAIHRAKAAAAQFNPRTINTGEHLRQNFLTMVETVREQDGSLLDQDELNFASTFASVSAPAQCLFLRLWQRRGPLFRITLLNYSEVSDIEASVEELYSCGLVSINHLGNQAAAAATATEVQSDGHVVTSTTAVDQQDIIAIQSSTAGTCTNITNAWGDIANVLTVPELRSVLMGMQQLSGKAFSIAANLSRAQVLLALGKFVSAPAPAPSLLQQQQQEMLLEMLLNVSGPLVKLEESATLAAGRIQRLFFLNEGQSIAQYLATDLGGLKYPSYTIHRSRAAFASRQVLLDYESALHHAAELTDALEAGEMEEAERAIQHAWTALDNNTHKLPLDTCPSSEQQEGPNQQPLFLRRFHAAWIYCMMATAGVSLLEKQKRYSEAVDRLHQLLGGWCCPSRRGEWWLRLSTDLEHMNRPTDSLEIAEAALADEWLSRGDRLALQRRILRLGKPPRRWKKPTWAEQAQYEPREVRITARPLANIIGLKSKFYGVDDQQCTVEELALQHYSSAEGGTWQGVHCEGGIWATLFGLLMWEVLFTPIPDVFRTPFQTAPLDLDTDAFYPTRREAIEACLARIAQGHAPSMLEATWEAHCGCMCRGVAWERWTLSELQTIAQCIGGGGLSAVCRLLAGDHAGWSGGMPDLLLWRSDKLKAKLSEVKGPRDRLSDQQRAWMAALQEAGLDVEVLKVVEPGKSNARGIGGRGKGKTIM